MTLHINIFSFTITISKREISLKNAIHNEQAQKIYEENQTKIEYYKSPY